MNTPSIGRETCVGASFAARCAAIQALVDPHEAAFLVPRVRCPHHELVCALAGWWTRAMESRELRYIPDPPTCDRWSSPRATLRRRGGDCDDLAILAASILRADRVGASVVVGSMQTPRGAEGHAWVEGHDRDGWFLFEATSGWHTRGARPPNYRASYSLSPGHCVAVGA